MCYEQFNYIQLKTSVTNNQTYYMLLYNSISLRHKIMFCQLEKGPIASYRLSGMLKSLLAALKFGQWTMMCLIEQFCLLFAIGN